MPETTLADLIERNARHVEALTPGHFDAVENEQRPAAVSVCCSDSRVSQEGMWSVEEPGWLFTASTIGNLVWDEGDDELVVDGSVLYPMRFTDTKVTVVVGHTGCGAVSAALAAVRGNGPELPAGVAKRVRLLVPVVETALNDSSLSSEDETRLVNELVEINVDRQVDFLLESDDVPDDEQVYGFVYDFQRAYGDVRGRAYLVNAGGDRDVDNLRSLAPQGLEDHIGRLTP